MIHARGTHVLGLGLEEMLMGQDPLQPEALWDRLYTGSLMTGRRGLGICAMGALDMALWDIRGKAMGKPCWEFLGGARKHSITPYASLLPTGRTPEAYRDSLVAKAREARQLGFRAGKMEVCVKGPYSHNGLQESDDWVVRIVAACREAVGPDFTMMVDVCYCWTNAKEALRVMRQLEPYDLFFLETPLQLDDLDGLRVPPRSLADSCGSGRTAELAIRVSGLDGSRKSGCGATGRGTGWRTDGGAASVRSRRRSRAADRAALLEDGHRNRRIRALECGDAALSLYRVSARCVIARLRCGGSWCWRNCNWWTAWFLCRRNRA